MPIEDDDTLPRMSTSAGLMGRVMYLEGQVSRISAEVAVMNRKLTLGILVLGALVTGRELPWLSIARAIGIGP